VTRHVDFLVRLFRFWAAFNAIIGLALSAFACGAATIVVTGARVEGPGTEVAAGVTTATFAVMALAALVWAGAHAWCGRGLAARRAWARNAALVLSVLNLLVLPFGTALGLYTLWVVLHEDVRGTFET
jgi:hypothetical protein